MRIKTISLRYKLMAALTVIPFVGLTSFLILAKTIFEKDKIAYVFDSSLSVSKTRAARVSSEVASVISGAQAVVLSYRADTKNLADTGTYFFEREAKFEAFQLYAWNAETSSYERTVDLAKANGKKLLSGQEKTVQDLVAQAKNRAVNVRGIETSMDRMLLAARFGEINDPRHVVAIALFEAAELAQVFSERGPYLSFLSRKEDGAPVFMTPDAGGDWGPEKVWAELSRSNAPEGIAEIASTAQVPYLASFSEVGVADLVVVSLVDKNSALAAVEILLRKSSWFFVAVLGLTVFIAVIISRSLTYALSHLSAATQKVAEGDFGVRVDIDSGGEIGQLATSFNAMAGEVSRLMMETAEKARMESELATAKAVQDSLFPESNATIGSLQISGHYVPASECGGDWWYYCENGDKVYVWIADATGHGAPAALLTSAARAVASVITMGDPLTVSECLGIMNRAICDTSKGKMMMTFFLACIDRSTGEMTYANASHEAPLLLHKWQDPDSVPKRDDFFALNQVNNPRLGEQSGIFFKEAQIQLQPGDQLVLYTDGVVDVKNPEAKNFGERRLLKSLAAQLTKSETAEDALSGVVQEIHGFRSEVALDDDVTLIICRYDGANSAVEPVTDYEVQAEAVAVEAEVSFEAPAEQVEQTVTDVEPSDTEGNQGAA